MRSRFAVPITIAVVFLLVVTGTVATFGGDKDPPAVATTAAVTTSATTTVNKSVSPTHVPTSAVKRSARPDIAALVFYSSKAEKGPLATPVSRQRLMHALEGVRKSKKSPEEDGLGLAPNVTGFINVEENWNNFVFHLRPPVTIDGQSQADLLVEASLEAEALRPFLNRGGTVLVLTDAEDKNWSVPCGPLSRAYDVSAQISFMIDEHDRFQASQATRLGSTTATPTNPGPSSGSVVTPQPSVIKTASAVGTGGQR
jgi:hypothetical protein